MHGNIKLTPERAGGILSALRMGLFIKEAAEYNDISERTYHEWVKRGREAIEHAEKTDTEVPYDERPFAEFAAAVRPARIAGAAVHLANLRTLALDERTSDSARVRASTWILERAYPETYSRRDTVELTGPTGEGAEPITIELKWPEDM